MNPRIRNLIGSLGILTYLCFHIWLAASLSVFVPNHWAAEMVYYVVAGLGWTLPVMPIISWMARAR